MIHLVTTRLILPVSGHVAGVTMASFFPTSSDREADPEVQVVGLDEEAGRNLVEVLSSETAQEIMQALGDEPMVASELAEATSSSIQNVHYHLDNLQEAGAVTAIDTEYSEKGREMTVYAPAGQPLVIVSNTERTDIEPTLRKLLGAVFVLGIASVIVEVVSPDAPTREEILNSAGAPAMPPPPGLVFFAGGLFVLVAVVLYWSLSLRV